MKNIVLFCLLLLWNFASRAQNTNSIGVVTTNGQIPLYVELTVSGDTMIYDTLFPDNLSVTLSCPGNYDIYAYSPGYEVINTDLILTCEEVFDLVFGESKYPPRNASFDSLNSILSWEKPRITALYEDFEDQIFPPEAWINPGDNWFLTESGSSGGFIVPEWYSPYACINDSINNNSDTLITPFIKLHEHTDYFLCFDSYYDGHGSQSAIYYSTDGWQTSGLLSNIIPAAEWEHIKLDLSQFAGPYTPNISFSFVGSQWAIDNVEIIVMNESVPVVQGYHCFLDDGFLEETTDTAFYYDTLQFNDVHTASVGALYTSGLSEKLYKTFTSVFLYPPNNLVGATYDNAVHLIWEPPLMPDTTGGDAGRDLWDTQFTFPCGDGSGEAGVESDGNYIYTSKWNAGNGTFFRYELDGTFLGSFVVSGGCMDVRDMAYDGELFWGSNAGTMVWGMDFEDEVVVETINAPVAVRAIAYDEEFDAFWANNWSTTITLFDKDGITLNSFSCGSWSSYYGFAWDNSQPGGPYLYGFSNEASGAVIVEMEIATGQETGFTYDAIGFSTTGTGLAGGLFIQDNIVQGYKTLGGMVQNETIFGLELGEASSGPGPLVVPENLLGFNLYKDEEYLDYVEYVEGQNNFDYWEYDVEPGCHAYKVSSIYDLYPYGMPGDSAESSKDGPAIICGGGVYPLPFFEDWEAGTFETKNWSVNGENWNISNSAGNPGKAAEFLGIPEQTSYTYSLKSMPFLAYDIVDGNIYFDFQVKLSDINENETEFLTIGIDIAGIFYPVDTLKNSGSTEYIIKHYDVSEIAKGHYFKIVFIAQGENSGNIEGWFIDNIFVYWSCAEPSNLSLEPQFSTEYSIAKLNWEPPVMYYDWLFYHDNTFENGVSAMEPGYGFAQLFEPEAYPASIQKVRFFIDGHLNHQNFIDVSLLSGDGNSVLAGPITVQAVDENSWITVDFGEISIEGGNFLVYIENNQADGPFIAVDNHQESPKLYYGSPGNFTELAQWGYHFISSCEVYVKHSPSDHVVQNSKALKPESMNFVPQISLSGKAYQLERENNHQRGFYGYNIWRNDELIEAAWPESHYSDTLTEAGEFSYFISAVYDQCESDTLGTVSISLFTDITETSKQNQINIYPNPASDQLIIETVAQDAIIHHFTLTSVSGQPVVRLSPDNRRIRLDVSLLPEGIYLAEIFSGGKREFRKIIIY